MVLPPLIYLYYHKIHKMAREKEYFGRKKENGKTNQ
uniref:Uncharacterized protein n=1 Tax=Myoviridae sp. ctfyA6 TaxID=2827698 RepID=A0A8S5STC1_9CAUD|nr:MAG TPA: hypothetical protein [Myoviridae sp. ctfyA6]